MIDTNTDHPDRRWGALPEEWTRAIADPLLAPWLLPVLSNPGYPVAPGSTLPPERRAKVPSWKGAYGGSGIPQWTKRPPALPEDLARWAADPDYGISFRTGRGIAAIDCDCDDPALAPAIRELLERTIGIAAGSLSYRHRGSPRWACLLRITDQPEAEPVPHDVITLTDGRGILETRGTGQQLVIAGTHKSGQRYRWTGPITVYPVTGTQYRDFLRTAEARYGDPGTPRSTSRAGAPRQDGESYDAPDSLRDWLLAQPGLVRETGRGGMLYLDCPLGDHDHDDPTSSAYMPAGSNGYHTPAYCCKHGKCAGKTVDDLRDWARAHGWEGDMPAAAYTDESAGTGAPPAPIRTDLYPDESAGTGTPPAQPAPAPYRPLYAADYAAGALEADLLLSTSYKTGFGRLDEVSGGIYPGLYVLGALSGMGKTSYCLQLADQMAAAGQHVIYVTLEQSPAELVSKSLARIEYLGRHHPAARSATGRITALQIRLDPRHRQSPEYLRALETYKTQSADRLSLLVGTFSTTIDTICDHVAAHIAATGQKPIVIVDYLQIIKPAAPGPAGSGKDTALRQQIDEHVQRLKLLSRENVLPVIVICSLNRTNYYTPFDVDSIKESGGIEYTADVVWGLQLKCVHTSEKELKMIAQEQPEIQDRRDLMAAAKERNPRELELVCAKNRFGRCYTLDLWYEADVDTFSFEAPALLALAATARTAPAKTRGSTGSKSRYY